MQLWVLRKLADVVSESLSLMFKKTWQLSEITSDWIKGNIITILNKKDSGNYQPVSLTYVPGNITEETDLEDVSKKYERQGGECTEPTLVTPRANHT